MRFLLGRTKDLPGWWWLDAGGIWRARGAQHHADPKSDFESSSLAKLMLRMWHRLIADEIEWCAWTVVEFFDPGWCLEVFWFPGVGGLLMVPDDSFCAFWSSCKSMGYSWESKMVYIALYMIATRGPYVLLATIFSIVPGLSFTLLVCWYWWWPYRWISRGSRKFLLFKVWITLITNERRVWDAVPWAMRY